MTEPTTPQSDAPNIPHTLRIEPHAALVRNFPLLIGELIAEGWSLARIAYRCDVSRQTVANWRAGEGEPDYSEAIIIIGLHHCWCGPGKGRDDVALAIMEVVSPA